MSSNLFLQWLSKETASAWWHDSADLEELEAALSSGATGVTTNPVLVRQAIYAKPDQWRPRFADMAKDLGTAKRIEELIRRVTVTVAEKLQSTYEAGRGGYVCAQVDPAKAGDRTFMLDMARRLHSWAPNIAVKLPVTAAGLDVLQECAAEGITVTATVSFTLPQVLAIAEYYQRGLKACRAKGKKPAPCYAVVMVGRIDDYIRDVVHDNQIPGVLESDIIQCGTAIMKRALEIYQQRGYEATLLPAGMRGAYHATELAGAPIVMSIHPKIQHLLAQEKGPFRERYQVPIDEAVLTRLLTVKEFERAYTEDVMPPNEFITYGVVQKTLAQFTANWDFIGEFPL